MAQKTKAKNSKPQKELPLPNNSSGSNILVILCMPILLAITYFCYAPALKNTLTSWDDKEYVIENTDIKKLDKEFVKKSFSLKTGYIMGNYHPITMLSLAWDYKASKLNPKVYHKTNIILHLLNVVLVYLFIYLVSKNRLVAFMSCTLFALHPMNVESVAWVAERKNLLFAFFELGALCMYTLYINSKKFIYYCFAILLFILSALSKATAVSMTILLPLIDYYLGRNLLSWKVIVEKFPFFIISLVFGLIAIDAQHSSNTINISNYSFYDRILFAGYGFCTYLWKFIYPTQLRCFYDYPKAGTFGWYIIFPAIAIAICILVYLSLRKTKKIVFGFLFFLISIALLLQLLPVGGSIMAERFAYIPYTGIFFLIGEGFYYVWSYKGTELKNLRWVTAVVLLGFSVGFAITTNKQCEIWKDTYTLWDSALKIAPDMVIGLNGRGDGCNEKGMYNNAVADFTKAIQLRPDYVEAYYNRGISYYLMGKELRDAGNTTEADKYFDNSIQDNTSALKYRPTLAKAYYNRSGDYFTTNRYKDALADAEKAKALGMEIDPQYIIVLEKNIEAGFGK